VKARCAPVSTSEVGAEDEDGARSSEDERGALASRRRSALSLPRAASPKLARACPVHAASPERGRAFPALPHRSSPEPSPRALPHR